MMKTLFTLLALLPTISAACLWVDGTTLDGKSIEVEGFSPAQRLRQYIAMQPSEKARELQRRVDDTGPADLTDREREAVLQILRGETERAIEILLDIEARNPGRYSTTANLGTAYELHGNNVAALKWIREGVRRNPEAHHGTEWLHILILETKLEIERNPGHLNRRRMIELPGGFSHDSEIRVSGIRHTVSEIQRALRYQLEERVVFVKPEDPVVADMVFLLGEIEGRLSIVEFGLELFQLADEYGFTDRRALKEMTRRFESAKKYGRAKRYTRNALIGVLVILVLYFAYRKRWITVRRRNR